MGRLRPLKYKLNTKQPCKVKIFEKYAVVRAKLFLTTYSSVGGRWFQGNSKGEKNTTNKFQTLMALTLSSTFNSNFPHGSICPGFKGKHVPDTGAGLRQPQFPGLSAAGQHRHGQCAAFVGPGSAGSAEPREAALQFLPSPHTV